MEKQILNFLKISALVLILSTVASAQTSEKGHGFAYKVLFINYDEPLESTFDDFLETTTRGVELAYIRNLHKNFNLAFPLKMGTADLPDGNGNLQTSQLFGSLDVLGQLGLFKGDRILAPYLLAGVGATYINRNFGDNEFNPHIPLGVGLNVQLVKNFYIQLQYEYRYAFEDNRTHDHVGIGVAWLMGGTPPPADADGDGVTDDIDACPNTAGIAALKGCPDADGDGITDKSDNCPTVAGLSKYNGCPDTDEDGIIDGNDNCPKEAGPKSNNGCPIADADNDGVNDDVDKCPNQAGPKSNNGCPDADGDGVNDAVDKCPNEAGPVSNNGCPVKDNDGDGVPNDKDDCPNAKGLAQFNGCPDSDGDGVMDKNDKCPTTKGPASNSGCPEIKKEDKEVLTFAMKAVQFNTGKASLKTISTKVLDEVAEILKKYPNYSLSISGHTDSVGGAATNQRLSELRAKSCYEYLATKGITTSRMSYVGYGEVQPIADNMTKAGRDINRRVEFNIFLK